MGVNQEGIMAKRKRYTAAEIINKLREAEFGLSKGQTLSIVCRALEISEQTYYRWRKEYGGLKINCGRRPENVVKTPV